MSLPEEQIPTLHEVISQFRGWQETFPLQLQEIRDTLTSQQQQLNLTNNALSQDTNNIKVKLPSQFDGKQPGQCNTFFSQLAIYFAANHNYNTDERKIMFAISCITVPAFTFIEPFIAQMDTEPKPEILTNFDIFKNHLSNAFGDSDPIATAEMQLRKLRQGFTSSVSIYATRFRMYAQSAKWNDAALISKFKTNLFTPIQQELARRPNSTNLESLIFDAIEIGNKLIRGPNQGESATKNYNTTPIDVDHKQPSQQGRISCEERDRRNTSRSCFYCGDGSHFKKDCPLIKRGHQSLNTFVLNTVTPLERIQPAFSSLPAAKIISETMKSLSVEIPRSQDGLFFVPLVFGTTKPGQYKRVQALLDTGASASVVRQDLVKSLNLTKNDTTDVSTSFIVGNGQATVANARLTTKIRISNTIFHSGSHDFYVVPDCSFEVIQ